MAGEVWSMEWPIKPGYYWFYGWTHKCNKGELRLDLAQIMQISNGIVHIAHNEFIHKSEGAEGWWTPCQLPDLPPHKEALNG